MISDVVMPTMDGPTTAREARKPQPDLPILFISGYAEEQLRKSIDIERRLPRQALLGPAAGRGDPGRAGDGEGGNRHPAKPDLGREVTAVSRDRPSPEYGPSLGTLVKKLVSQTIVTP